MLEIVILIPLLSGGAAFLLPARPGRANLIAAGLLHLTACIAAVSGFLPAMLPQYFAVTPMGGLVLIITSFLYLMTSIYTVSYMNEIEMHNEPAFNGSMLLFLAAMSMAAIADHIIVLWIAIEATTLTSAPLILLHKSKGALEATWKYVLICSVGIALALLSAFSLILAMSRGGVEVPLTYNCLNGAAASLDPLWLKVSFIFAIVGYGTKMGLAPMHTWLPDAHSEAVSPASALLSGALLNCAFLGVYKTHVLLTSAGIGRFSDHILIVFGLFSILVAGVFILHQNDYKRLLAYSSIENMGIIAFGSGLGGLGAIGAVIHMIHHSLIKSSLFLTSGNILLGYGSKEIKQVKGMIRLLPGTAVAFFSGFTGISGLPPFGLVISELFIILGALRSHHPVAIIIFISGLLLVFSGACRHIIPMTFGSGTSSRDDLLVPDKLPRLLPSYILLAVSVFLTFWMPETIWEMIRQAAALMGGAHA
ncbi:MAG: hydrogenase [Deltaproteobacteria bacterium]|nr:hydrogenase [Deltaproteobacteria bacterium]